MDNFFKYIKHPILIHVKNIKKYFYHFQEKDSSRILNKICLKNIIQNKNTFVTVVTHYTLPTAEILSGKNARAWVSMVLYLKK